jgi:hypothetical protein
MVPNVISCLLIVSGGEAASGKTLAARRYRFPQHACTRLPTFPTVDPYEPAALYQTARRLPSIATDRHILDWYANSNEGIRLYAAAHWTRFLLAGDETTLLQILQRPCEFPDDRSRTITDMAGPQARKT